jgi:hypothetical protein
MRQRTIALAAVALLAVPIAASCRRPPTGGPVVGGAVPGPAAGQENCGTINAADHPATPDETKSAECFLKYHTVVASEYLKIVDGNETTVLQASNHTVTITRAAGGIVTKVTVCNGGGGDSQFNVTGEGEIIPLKALGNNCQY